MPPELVEAVRAVFGGVGIMILFGAWGLYRHFTSRERERRDRLDRGFSTLDESRDREIKRLHAEIETINKRHEVEIGSILERAAEDLARCERANVRKRGEISDLQKRLEEIEDNRDEGWDKGRGMETIAHEFRHLIANLLMATYAAGRFSQPMPELIRRVYEAGQAGQDMPHGLMPERIPPLQHVRRKPPTD